MQKVMCAASRGAGNWPLTEDGILTGLWELGVIVCGERESERVLSSDNSLQRRDSDSVKGLISLRQINRYRDACSVLSQPRDNKHPRSRFKRRVRRRHGYRDQAGRGNTTTRHCAADGRLSQRVCGTDL